MKSISLLKDWQMCFDELSVEAKDFEKILSKNDGWMSVESLPCDVHMPLIENGIIEEPLVADNTLRCKWIEEKSFWFLKKFTLMPDDLSPHGVELFLGTLDIHADIFINNKFAGHHASAMYPFCKNVKRFLKDGENSLLIRLTTGLDAVRDEDIAEVRDSVSCEWRRRRADRGEDRRCALRKPQFLFGWDQAPRLASCGIAGDARLDVLDETVVRDILFETRKIDDDGAHIFAEAEIESRRLISASECDVVFTVEYDGEVVYEESRNYMSQAGTNYVDFEFVLKDPKLWWPNGYGEQNLYRVKVWVKNNNGATDEKEIVTGVRTVKLDTSAIDETNRNYAFWVNGVKIYARGSDFIFSDCMYIRTEDELQKKLLTGAKNANFCMLRFWDGNVYQTDWVYKLCDELGLLVIQNFCFAYSVYPDHLEWFRKEVENEARYQIKRIRNHPSLALWYGNGENSSMLKSYLGREFFELYDPEEFPGGTYIYNTLLPRLCRELSKTVGYQFTTPFGSYTYGECAERGDRHYYPFVNTAPENQEYRISTESIDPLECKFITETGIMGPPSAEALISYCGGRENTAYDSPVFLHHRNTFEKDAVRDGIYKHYTGERELTLEEYCLYGGMFQGVMIGYEAEHIRVQKDCGGSLLWVLNDGFGEVGFSFMDHFGNPKPVYYFLKRAYAPQRLILKKDGDEILVYCTNSSHKSCKFNLEYGYTDFEGKKRFETRTVFLLPHIDREVVAKIDCRDSDIHKGLFYAKTDKDEILSATFHACDHSLLEIPKKPVLWVEDVKTKDGKTEFTVCTDSFAHGVHFGKGADVIFSDLYFDLLPGEKRRIICYGEINPEPLCVTKQSV